MFVEFVSGFRVWTGCCDNFPPQPLVFQVRIHTDSVAMADSDAGTPKDLPDTGAASPVVQKERVSDKPTKPDDSEADSSGDDSDDGGGRSRPVRAAAIQRFDPAATEKKVTRELLAGNGVALSAMPNVMTQLAAISRSAPELQVAHRLCFGKTCKPTKVG